VGAFTAGVFHLFTHAWFKALLFLAAGNVIQAYGTQDIREMGGVWSRMRITAWAMLLGCCSAAGVVFFAGFWSKDSIVAGVLRNEFPDGGHHSVLVKAVLIVAVSATSLLGAIYPFRMFFIAFLGEPARRRGFVPQRVREAAPSMRWPVIILAALACVAGFVGIPGARVTFGNLVFAGAQPQHEPFAVAGVLLGGGLALIGVAVAYLIWVRPYPALARLPARMGRLAVAARNGFYVDTAYAWLVDRLVLRPAALIPRVDEGITDAVADGIADGVRAAAVEGRRLQGGRLQAYALTAFVGVVLMAGGFTLAATGHFPGVGATR
jgi:NADH-quinone oxidoreductase subunit L